MANVKTERNPISLRQVTILSRAPKRFHCNLLLTLSCRRKIMCGLHAALGFRVQPKSLFKADGLVGKWSIVVAAGNQDHFVPRNPINQAVLLVDAP